MIYKDNKKLTKYDIEDYSLKNNDLKEIIKQMAKSGGFESVNLVDGITILQKMIAEPQCTKFLSFVGAIISTGVRGIIKDMIKKNMFDCIITTCGALDHDLARSFVKYYAGDFNVDDYYLKKNNIHRLGNVFIPIENYGPLIESKIQEYIQEFYKNTKEFAGYELLDYIGSKLEESSFLYWAHKNKIPVIVPGIVDGAVGNQIWLFYQNHKDMIFNILKDQTKMSDMIFEANKTGALMLGGGISKHHTLWWNQFRDGLDYAVYITTANEWDGSLSGAEVKEAISWNKVKSEAKQVTIHGEITTLLPFLYSSL
ncbi:MAG TPA: deoxyhypusine synthase [Nitrososphaeraceae archaeon]|jgi:deoxyhypusine synthase|nr:deoxyhypusine synthase [Nitrososphaeraceae archaeon]